MKNFSVLTKRQTLRYIKNEFNSGKRVVVSRYADGEYDIITSAEKSKIARQLPCKELTTLLTEAMKKSEQLVCLPYKIMINNNNLNNEEGNLKLGNKIAKYIIQNTDHSIYGQVQWRDLDADSFNWDITTDFFLNETLLVTPFKEDSKRTFDTIQNNKVDIYESPFSNAFEKYYEMKSDLINCSKKYKNIVFGCGPVAKILISDLISECNSNLIDIGASVGVIVAPFSKDYFSVRSWPGFLRRSEPERIQKYADSFYKTLKEKLDKK